MRIRAVLIALAALAAGTWAVAGELSTSELRAIGEGRGLYLMHCAGCHATGLQGSMASPASDGGEATADVPDLTLVARARREFQPPARDEPHPFRHPASELCRPAGRHGQAALLEDLPEADVPAQALQDRLAQDSEERGRSFASRRLQPVERQISLVRLRPRGTRRTGLLRLYLDVACSAWPKLRELLLRAAMREVKPCRPHEDETRPVRGGCGISVVLHPEDQTQVDGILLAVLHETCNSRPDPCLVPNDRRACDLSMDPELLARESNVMHLNLAFGHRRLAGRNGGERVALDADVLSGCPFHFRMAARLSANYRLDGGIHAKRDWLARGAGIEPRWSRSGCGARQASRRCGCVRGLTARHCDRARTASEPE